MGDPAKFESLFEDFEENATRRITAFDDGEYVTGKGGLDGSWRGIRFKDSEQERRFLDFVALIRLLRDIYGHEFIRQVTEHLHASGLRLANLDISEVEKPEYLALSMLDPSQYKWWMLWFGSIGVEKRIEKPGVISWGTTSAFEFFRLSEDRDGFKLRLKEWSDVARQITELNALAELEG